MLKKVGRAYVHIWNCKLSDLVNIACRLQIYTNQDSDNFLNLNEHYQFSSSAEVNKETPHMLLFRLPKKKKKNYFSSPAFQSRTDINYTTSSPSIVNIHGVTCDEVYLGLNMY